MIQFFDNLENNYSCNVQEEASVILSLYDRSVAF
jgi:hypothetical protein